MSEQWTDEQLDGLLDVGLDGLGMEELPAFFLQNTMRRIQPVVRFQLQWVDIGLPVAGTLLFSVLYWLYLAWMGGKMPAILTTITNAIGWEVLTFVMLELIVFGFLFFYLWGDDQPEWVLASE